MIHSNQWCDPSRFGTGRRLSQSGPGVLRHSSGRLAQRVDPRRASKHFRRRGPPAPIRGIAGYKTAFRLHFKGPVVFMALRVELPKTLNNCQLSTYRAGLAAIQAGRRGFRGADHLTSGSRTAKQRSFLLIAFADNEPWEVRDVLIRFFGLRCSLVLH